MTMYTYMWQWSDLHWHFTAWHKLLVTVIQLIFHVGLPFHSITETDACLHLSWPSHILFPFSQTTLFAVFGQMWIGYSAHNTNWIEYEYNVQYTPNIFTRVIVFRVILWCALHLVTRWWETREQLFRKAVPSSKVKFSSKPRLGYFSIYILT